MDEMGRRMVPRGILSSDWIDTHLQRIAFLDSARLYDAFVKNK
jgi:hypothetical protein